MQQVPRGEPIRVTHHEADDYEPSFSPDGRSIVFRSDREGGGIYVVPALGGEARKIAERGRRPRYSPDGEWIAYWEGPRHRFGRIYVVASAGGQPKRAFSDSECARSPVWTPDGKHLLLFWGGIDLYAALSWSVTPLDGGPVVNTGVMEVLYHRGLSGTGNNPFLLDPEAWLEGNQVVFSAMSKSGDSTDLWKISLSPNTWQVASEPQRLTVGSGLYRYASASEGGRLVFSSLTRNPDVWSLPVDANRGTVAGEMQQLTHGGADDVKPSVSLDGKRMVFESNRSGKRVVWTKDLETGKEQALTGTPSSENLPVISADGSEVVYIIAHWPSQSYEMFVMPFEGGPSKRVCDDACSQPVQWSSDGSKILYNGGNPSYVALLDIRTGQKVKLVSHPNLEIYGGGFTPDQRWISFDAISAPGRQPRSFIAPYRDRKSPPESAWIPTEGGSQWSPDGNLLYGLSDRDGFPCLYAYRLDPKTKRPVGAPQPIHHFHSARRAVIEDPAWVGLSVARDKIVLTLVELAGNIWMAEQQSP